MSKCGDLLDKASRNPQGLRFEEALALAVCWGFALRKTSGKGRGTSHHIYKRPGIMQMLNFQPTKDGKAKRVQVMQLLSVIDQLIEDGEAEK